MREREKNTEFKQNRAKPNNTKSSLSIVLKDELRNKKKQQNIVMIFRFFLNQQENERETKPNQKRKIDM